MSVVSNTLIGPSRKKIGNAVFSTWKGVNVLKQKPASVANPNTINQQMRRSAMTQIVFIFRQIPGAVKLGFKKLAIKKSEWNAFSSYNLQNAFDYSAPPAADFIEANFLISKGTIQPTAVLTVVADDSSNTIITTYPTTFIGSGQSALDNILLVFYNEDQDEWLNSSNGATRADGTQTTVLPANWVTGDTVDVFLGFYNSVSGESSDSTHASTTIVA